MEKAAGSIPWEKKLPYNGNTDERKWEVYRMIPFLKKQGNKTVLMADGKPFVMLCGETHNSNSSTETAMDAACRKAVALKLNSVIAPISWELVEPEEGRFDFSTVDMVVGKAREYGLRLELIWFGSWKNAQCTYAPEWVKKDRERFRRAEMEQGKRCVSLYDGSMHYSTLSYLGEETMKADAKAFHSVMQHIRRIDEGIYTVLMVQVENETGVMGAAREHSVLADRLYQGQAPEQLADYLRSTTETMEPDVREAVSGGSSRGSWEECFGACAEEIFSAYYTARYVECVAKAGKEAYPLPLSVNCWLDQGGGPGDYPSGGPVARMMEVWKFCAPDIDIFAPDIYVRDFYRRCESYQKNGNPLFIPETACHSYAGGRQLYTVGHYHGICFSPFGFEDMGEPFTAAQSVLFGVDVTDPALAAPQDAEEYQRLNGYLQSMMFLAAPRLGSADMDAVSGEYGSQMLTFYPYGFKMHTTNPFTGETNKQGAALVIRESGDTFYVLAQHCIIEAFSTDETKCFLDYLAVEEGYFEGESWVCTLRRNGDEIAQIGFDKPALMKFRLSVYD